MIKKINKRKLKLAIKDLGVREQSIIKMRFGLDGLKPHTLAETGKEFRITRERVRQIEAATMKKLERIDRQIDKIKNTVNL